jgi:hypothetical protein
MAYGRLDVYWPDGRIESYLLEAPNVTVGRATDNSIVLDTETVSRRHFSITHTDNLTYINDLESENGVMIDGVPLQAYEAHVLQNVEELQVGYLRIIFNPIDDSITAPIRSADDVTQPVASSNAEFGIKVDLSEFSVWPASSSSSEVAITNRLREPRRFFVNISGMPTEWMRVNRPEVEIAPNETTYVLINVKPPRRFDVKPATYPVIVEVTPKDKPESVMRLELMVHVRSYGGFGMALSAKQVNFQDGVAVYLHNQGSDDLTLALSAQSPTNALSPKFSMTKVTLSAGARSQINVSLQPTRRRLVGKPETHKFVVLAQAQNASRFVAAIAGKATVEPRLPLWGVITGAGILGALLIIGILALVALLSPNPTPTLTNVRVNTAQIAQGDPLEVTWQVSNAQKITVFVNSIVADTLDGNATQAIINTDELNGDVNILVQAQNGDNVIEIGTTSVVYLPMTIVAFEVQPQKVFRNVLADLTLSWEVTGANDIQIRGLETFTTQPLTTTGLEAVGTLGDIIGFPQDDTVITLFVADNVGNTADKPIALTITDPTCTTLQAVNGHQGPGNAYPFVSAIAPNTALIVLSQDTSGWLKVRLPNGTEVWGLASGFACDASFNLTDLRQEANIPPTPIPTATPLPPRPNTPVPSPTRPVATPNTPATPRP